MKPLDYPTASALVSTLTQPTGIAFEDASQVDSRIHQGYRSRQNPVTLAPPPPFLSPQYSRIEDVPGEWMIVRTLAQREQRIVRGLAKEGLDFFFPYQVEVGRYNKPVYVPEFRSYLFVTADARDYLECPEMEPYLLARSRRWLRIEAQPRFVGDMVKLLRATEQKVKLITSPLRVKGQRVLVVGDHPMAGVTGLVDWWEPAGMMVHIAVHVMVESKSFEVPEKNLVRW